MLRRVNAPSRSYEMHGHDDTTTGCAEIDRNAAPDSFRLASLRTETAIRCPRGGAHQVGGH